MYKLWRNDNYVEIGWWWAGRERDDVVRVLCGKGMDCDGTNMCDGTIG